MDADFGAEQFGEFYVFIPLTDAARDWVAQNVDLSGLDFLCGSFAVETKRLEEVVALIERAGLVVVR
jgi:hypothetical protein